MLRRLLLGAVRPSRTSCLSTLAETNSSEAEEISYPAYDTPTIVSRNLEFPTKDGRSRKAWVENLDSVAERKLGMVDLHPEIFAVPPRLDMLWANIRWQEMYKKVNLVHVNNRAEMIGGGRKPWQQKGLGRARQGSIRAPQWVNGGSVNGPRSPTSWFYMLPIHTRLYGLRSVLSIKLAQDDLHIVNSLDIPTNEPSFLEDLAEERQWGPSVLFVDDTDYALENIAVASDKIKHMNLMPVYGLNVYSMLKHDTLVLTLAALDRIEKQMLYFMNRTDRAILGEKFRASTV